MYLRKIRNHQKLTNHILDLKLLVTNDASIPSHYLTCFPSTVELSLQILAEPTELGRIQGRGREGKVPPLHMSAVYTRSTMLTFRITMLFLINLVSCRFRHYIDMKLLILL